jgi:hypothetical protein
MNTPAPTHGFGDSVLADEYDDALAASAYQTTDPNGDLWTIQPLQPHPACRPLFTGHSLICVEQYNGPGEIACYQPVCLASSEIEAITLISQDYLHRSAEAGDLCPEGYALWTRDDRGHYRRTAEISKA